MSRWSLQGKLLYPTPRRMFFAICAALAFALVIFSQVPDVMPVWVHRLHIPLWFARYWMFIAIFLLPIGAIYAGVKGWLEPKPDPNVKAQNLPLNPSLSNEQYWPWLKEQRQK